MRIQKFDNTTFGYSKKLNRQLIKKLDKEKNQDDYITQTIRNLNNLCNNTEDMLTVSVKNDKSDKDFLFGTLLKTKSTLANLVEAFYPELDYTKREIQSYTHDTQKDGLLTENSYPWRIALASELSMILQDIDAKNLIPEQEKKIEKTENKAIQQASPAPDFNIIEKFEPSFSSPKGFDSLGGMTNLKEEMYDKIINPALHPEQAELDFAEYGKKAPRGIMLYGPPGCGKTSIIEALSAESKLPLFKLKISKAGSPLINQTSVNYQKAFDYVAECAQMIESPCLLFIDEIDGLTKGRNKDSSSEDLKQIGTLLNLIESARDRNIIVLGATNKYDIVDDAIKRRFDEQMYLGMPDTDTREQILYKTLSQWLKGIPLAEESDDLKEIADRTSGFPSSAIVILADKASNIARKDGRRIITKEDFFTEIEKNQNLKIKEADYQTKSTMKKIGYKRG